MNKIFKLTLLILAVFLAVACGKKDENSGGTENGDSNGNQTNTIEKINGKTAYSTKDYNITLVDEDDNPLANKKIRLTTSSILTAQGASYLKDFNGNRKDLIKAEAAAADANKDECTTTTDNNGKAICNMVDTYLEYEIIELKVYMVDDPYMNMNCKPNGEMVNLKIDEKTYSLQCL